MLSLLCVIGTILIMLGVIALLFGISIVISILIEPIIKSIFIKRI